MKKFAGAVNYRYLLSLLLSILFAFLIGAGILAVSGFHPLEAYGAMLSGAFDSARHIGDFLEYAMVLCVCGLACVLGARVGIFNVGGEGQLLLGAIFAAQVGVWMDGQPRFLVIVCAALAAMAVGGLYAFLPGVLKVKVKVNEVITTIMLNTVAAYLCQYLAKGPWKNANKNMVAATEQLGAQYWFGSVIPRSNLTSAVFAAAVMAFLVWYVMERTSVGYEMRITGENPRFAFFSGLRTDQIAEDRRSGHGAYRHSLADLPHHSDRYHLLHGRRERHHLLAHRGARAPQSQARRRRTLKGGTETWMTFPRSSPAFSPPAPLTRCSAAPRPWRSPPSAARSPSTPAS